MKIKLIRQWSDYPTGTILSPGISLAHLLVEREYAVAVEDEPQAVLVETAVQPVLETAEAPRPEPQAKPKRRKKTASEGY